MVKQITIRLPDELKKEIQQQADHRGITKSNLIRSIIFRYLQNIFQESTQFLLRQTVYS